jgi:hypothetical protein
MKIIIQCAGSKRDDAPTLSSGPVVANFVSHADLAPDLAGKCNVTPDDEILRSGRTWRDLLLDSQSSDIGLLPAHSLYEPKNLLDPG